MQLTDVHLTLGRRRVLCGVDWRIRPGERWILTGANGAGKTQLLKLLAGDVWPTADAGRRRYLWRGRRYDQPYEIRDEIAYVGAERQDRFEHYGWNHPIEQVVGAGLHRTEILLDPLTAAEERRITRLLSRLHLGALAGRLFLTLSYGERRLVLLARALASAPRLLLLDEIFNGLDTEYRERVQQVLRVLSRSPLPWVLATHREEDIPGLATHWCRVQGGRLMARRLPRLGSVGIARRVNARAAARAAVSRIPKPQGEAPLLSLRHASVWREGRPALHRVSFELYAGQCWVLHGPNGSGKSTLIQTLYGDIGVAVGGTLQRAGVEPGVPIAFFKRRVGLIAPELQAAHPRYLRVDEVVASGLHSSIGLDASRRAPRDRMRRALARVGAASLINRSVKSLSYGQLRRVLFARALVHEPDLLLLDEPYAGLDSHQRRALRLLIERAIALGVTVVIATHHAQEWPVGATHELELQAGRVRYAGPVRELRAAA